METGVRQGRKTEDSTKKEIDWGVIGFDILLGLVVRGKVERAPSG